jgi:hypothetical protein
MLGQPVDLRLEGGVGSRFLVCGNELGERRHQRFRRELPAESPKPTACIGERRSGSGHDLDDFDRHNHLLGAQA